ncbi:hypothetical protein [Xanthomonas sacchari]|uniref:hypothetical protein n=1 Tax=Xanthomonas sacchari TaxID=56458 RepID=UPI00225C1D49|nr:hypothetical protein [Xanthomonas sacchari]
MRARHVAATHFPATAARLQDGAEYRFGPGFRRAADDGIPAHRVVSAHLMAVRNQA